MTVRSETAGLPAGCRVGQSCETLWRGREARRRRAARRRKAIAFGAVLATVAMVSLVSAERSTIVPDAGAASTGIHKIKHVIVIMQENRSFDNYFGTYPGADGIPMSHGMPKVCVPDPVSRSCDRPYIDHHDVSQGGPHAAPQARADIDGGKMDGFVRSIARVDRACIRFADPTCADGPLNTTDVLGYHSERDIPNYWTYARDFVLQDHLFEPAATWSLPAHLFMVSEWSADCRTHHPSSCTNALNHPGPSPVNHDPIHVTPGPGSPIYAWTDLTYLLYKNEVSWDYYVTSGTEPDCVNPAALTCVAVPQNPRTPGIWNPLPYFDTVRRDGQTGNIQSVSRFYAAAKAGTLPTVSWVVPSGDVSEHPPASISAGQSYVTSLIDAVMRGPDWNSTAIFLAWDDWGGFYDHVVPPKVDRNGYGLRVPGLVIGPYAKHGYVDHQVLSFDAYVKFIEDDFLHGQRLDPKTDGRPDARPDVRENKGILGNLANDFNFNQPPRPPVLLPVHPATTLTDRAPFQPVLVSVHKNRVTGRITVIWQQPSSNGGTPITSYEVVPYEGGVAQSSHTFGPHADKAIITGLTRGALYTFTVAGVNNVGVGPPSTHTPVVKA